CENNLYAMGTALARAQSEVNLSAKAAAYRIPAAVVDGMDVEAVERAARTACDAIRAGGGPFFLELRTYRFRAHSMFDPELYRDRDEVKEWETRCPIATWSATLRARGVLDDTTWQELERRVAEEVDDAVAFSEAAAWEPVETLTRHVYSERAR
ncbi:MAG TPA: thiamine pyrophosphate-dependent enzyme, partial [Gemmatimonadaceae bacterium]|nr:thiamine pyrophosphate-dependent enzyme [Gemmatimonadaceae bacterium]